MPLGWGCARTEGMQPGSSFTLRFSVTSTDYDTAADATETSSYFSAQGYQSRWGPYRGGSAQQAGSPQPWHGGGHAGLDRQNPSPGGFTKATRSLSSMLTEDLRSHPD